MSLTPPPRWVAFLKGSNMPTEILQSETFMPVEITLGGYVYIRQGEGDHQHQIVMDKPAAQQLCEKLSAMLEGSDDGR